MNLVEKSANSVVSDVSVVRFAKPNFQNRDVRLIDSFLLLINNSHTAKLLRLQKHARQNV